MAGPSKQAPRWVPGLAPFEARDLAPWKRDGLAGLTLCALIIPAGLAHGELAGLPPIAGLFAAVVILVPWVALGVIALYRPTQPVAAALFALSACPAAPFAINVVLKVKGDSRLWASMMLTFALLAPLTIPAIMAWPPGQPAISLIPEGARHSLRERGRKRVVAVLERLPGEAPDEPPPPPPDERP